MSTPSPQAAPAMSLLHLAPRTRFSLGDDVRYYSATHSQWVDSKIVDISQKGDVQVACKPGRWITLEEQAAQLKLVSGSSNIGGASLLATAPAVGSDSIPSCFLPQSHLKVNNGDKAFYYSDSNHCWCPCIVVAISISGEIQIDIKHGYWISQQEQAQKMSFGLERPSHQPSGSFSELCAENLAAHDATHGVRATMGRQLASSVFAPSEISTPGTVASMVSRPPISHAMSSGAVPAWTPPSTTSSLRAEVGSVFSCRSVPEAKDFSRVAFDPGVSVTAFKPSLPPACTFDRGHQYECNLDSAVHVPRSFSFGSTSSLASSLGSQGNLRPSSGYRHQSSLAAVPETQENDLFMHSLTTGSASVHMLGESQTVVSSPMLSSMVVPVPGSTVPIVGGFQSTALGTSTVVSQPSLSSPPSSGMMLPLANVR